MSTKGIFSPRGSPETTPGVLPPDAQANTNQFLDSANIQHFIATTGSSVDYLSRTELTYRELIRCLRTQNLDLSSPQFASSIEFSNLTTLDLSNSEVTDAELANIIKLCPKLTSLNLAGCRQINDFNALNKVAGIISAIDLNLLSQNLDVSFLNNLISLSSLTLYFGTKPKGDFHAFGDSIAYFDDEVEIENFDFLENLKTLSSLEIDLHSDFFNSTVIVDFSALNGLPAFSNLKINNALELRNFGSLSDCPELSTITIQLSSANPNFHTQLRGFDLLTNFKKLSYLKLVNCVEVRDPYAQEVDLQSLVTQLGQKGIKLEFDDDHTTS